MTSTITAFLGADHKKCDADFLHAETLAAEGRWQEADDSFGHLATGLEQHFTMEEQVLFPAFEGATGNSNGPTAVMRNEHAQMRALLVELQTALRQQDQDAYAGHSETLHILMQQHNIKEENILYRMADRVLGAGALIPAMRACAAPAARPQQ